MFRKVKKRPTVARPLHTEPGEDDEDDEEWRLPAAQDRAAAKRRTVVRSFGGDNDDDDDAGAPASKKRRKRGGLGFGGAALPPEDDDHEKDAAMGTDAAVSGARGAAVSYDRDALSQLLSQQRKYVPEEKGEDAPRVPPPMQPEMQHEAGLSLNDDYLPLREPTVLTGEEALRFEEEQLQKLGDIDRDSVLPDIGDESSAWEDQVARRAGVSAPATALARPISPRRNKKYLSALQLREQMESTLTQLKTQYADIDRAQERRQAEANQTRDELQRQQGQVHEAGEGVEYYQVLRQRLADWIGALRQLQSKAIPIQRALHDLEAEVASNHRRSEWEMDMTAVLFQNNRLEQVVGKQPDSSIYDPLTTIEVDEFGRDVKSQATIQREQRVRRRRRIQEQRAPRGDEWDAFLTDDEKEALRERHDALQKALQVAIEELDEEYTVLQNAVDVFAEWRNKYPEDYKQCFASLSLADLAAVLIQTELCALNDPWNESEGYNESKWVAVVRSALEMGVLDDDGVERIIETAVNPSVADLLQRSGYNLVSSHQTRSLSNFSKLVQKIAPSPSPMMEKLKGNVIAYIQQNLSDMTIPIATKAEAQASESSHQELEEVLNGCTFGQMYRLKKILYNLIVYWGPFLGEENEFVETVLDFVSCKYLLLLSSLRQQQQPEESKFNESPTDAFMAIWQVLTDSCEWLDDPKWMLQAAPIRAAAAVYNANNVV